jgi:hypothetical protein
VFPFKGSTLICMLVSATPQLHPLHPHLGGTHGEYERMSGSGSDASYFSGALAQVEQEAAALQRNIPPSSTPHPPHAIVAEAGPGVVYGGNDGRGLSMTDHLNAVDLTDAFDRLPQSVRDDAHARSLARSLARSTSWSLRPSIHSLTMIR